MEEKVKGGQLHFSGTFRNDGRAQKHTGRVLIFGDGRKSGGKRGEREGWGKEMKGWCYGGELLSTSQYPGSKSKDNRPTLNKSEHQSPAEIHVSFQQSRNRRRAEEEGGGE